MSEFARDRGTEHVFQSIELIMDSPLVPGLSMVRTRAGLGTGEYSKGSYGQNDEPVDADTVYDLASLTKLYTTALVLRQVQENNLSLDDRLGEYLDGEAFERSSLTIRDLLSHRVDFGFGLAQYREEFADDFKGALLDIQVPDQPSDTVNYHNLSYLYLGYILEKVSGRTLDDQMTDLFSDLGLTNTYTASSVRSLGISCPATEVLSDGTIVENITHDESARLHDGLAGNAGVFASARDLAKFGWAWMNGQIVDKPLIDEALRDHDPTGNSPQGLGWWMRLKNGKKLPPGVYGHSGFTGCYLAIDTNTSEVTAITTNRTLMGRDNEGDQVIWEAALL